MDKSPCPCIDSPVAFDNGNCGVSSCIQSDDNSNVTCPGSISSDYSGSPQIVTNVQAMITCSSNYQSSDDFVANEANSMNCQGTLPMLRAIPIPLQDETSSVISVKNVNNTEEVGRIYSQEEKTNLCKSSPLNANADNDYSDSSDIDEDALSIIIAVEGEEDDDELKTEDNLLNLNLSPLNSNEGTKKLSEKSNEPTCMKVKCEIRSYEENHESTEKSSSKQSAKVKQFFTTLQMFGNKISQEVAEQVQELIAALVVCELYTVHNLISVMLKLEAYM